MKEGDPRSLSVYQRLYQVFDTPEQQALLHTAEMLMTQYRKEEIDRETLHANLFQDPPIESFLTAELRDFDNESPMSIIREEVDRRIKEKRNTPPSRSISPKQKR